MIEAYLIHLAILVGIYMILALSLQLNLGYTGLINLGHIAFFAIGAYVSALLVLNGLPFLGAFLLAGLVPMAVGFLLAVPLNRLRGDYVALATLAFTLVVYAIALNWNSLTRGPMGIPGIPRPSYMGFSLGSNLGFLVLVLFVLLLTIFVIRRVVLSRFGRVLEAVRDNETAAKVIGKNTLKVKMWSLGISSFFAGIAGSLYAHYMSFIDPTSFTVLELIPVLFIVIIGGLGSLRGTVLASFVVVLLPEPLRFLSFSSSIVGPARQIVYALVILLILIYRPKGFLGKVDLGGVR